jgi:carboxylesterase type B
MTAKPGPERQRHAYPTRWCAVRVMAVLAALLTVAASVPAAAGDGGRKGGDRSSLCRRPMACCGGLGPTGSRVSSGFPTPRRRSVIFAGGPRRRSRPGPASGTPLRTAPLRAIGQHQWGAIVDGGLPLPQRAVSRRRESAVSASGLRLLPRRRLREREFGSTRRHRPCSPGRIITVTVNYRLGVFGALAHPALTAEGHGDSGNYGFLDQQASLRWVQHWIADFGGDRTRVTIGGHSSSAQQICSHLSAPGSRGLFSAAIIESGPGCFAQPLAEAEQAGSAIAASVGCWDGGDVPACLRSRPPEALVDKTDGLPFGAVGTPTMPTDPRQNLIAGNFARVPVLISSNRDEARIFFAKPKISTEADYRASMVGRLGDGANEVIGHYPWQPTPADNGYTGNYLVSATLTDSFFACGNRPTVAALAAHTSTFVYEFAHRDGPGLGDRYPGFVWGAGHAAELPYLWPSFDNGIPIAATFDPAERRLARSMVSYWSAFVAKGASVRSGTAALDIVQRQAVTDVLEHRQRSRSHHRAEVCADSPVRVLGCLQSVVGIPVADFPGATVPPAVIRRSGPPPSRTDSRSLLVRGEHRGGVRGQRHRLGLDRNARLGRQQHRA